MAISFDPTPVTVASRDWYHRVALERMRPISRRYDEQEHALPTEWVDWFWAEGREGVPPDAALLAGGTDGFVQVCVQAEELCWGDAALYLRMPTPALGGSAVGAAGTPEPHERFLCPFRAKGGDHPIWGAMAITESGADSDAAAIETTARLDAATGEWVLDGHKIFCTASEQAATSQISSIKVDGGREVTLTYNPTGFVQSITAPEGKTLGFEYSKVNDLITFKDGRSLSTKFEYEDHKMMKRLTPKGHAQFVNTYDGERRVTKQIAGAGYVHDFTYGSNQTTLTENGKATNYYFNTDGTMNKVTYANGGSISYEYTTNKQRRKVIDQEGKVFEYNYDAKGNQIYEKDPLGYETTRIFDQTFSKSFC